MPQETIPSKEELINYPKVRIKKDTKFIHLMSPGYVNGKLDRVRYVKLMQSKIIDKKESYFIVF